MRLITLGLGAALGYLLGSAEGRKNLEKMTQNAQKLWNDPKTCLLYTSDAADE